MTDTIVGLNGSAGPKILTDGAQSQIRLARDGSIANMPAGPDYLEQTRRGNMFGAANQSVATTTVGLATTYTGLCLSNPIGSLVNLILVKASFMQSVIQATQPEAFALATGFSPSTNVTHTTPITPKPSLIGAGVTPQGLVDAAATLPVAPVYDTFLGNTPSATTDGTGGVFDLGGSIILPPGAFCAFVTPAQASVAGMWFGLKWLELPI